MIKGLLYSFLVMSFLALSQGEYAFQLVKAKTINSTLSAQFPIQKSFQGMSATFSKPKIMIDVLDQSIKLQMTASAAEDSQQLIATLIFNGELEYDSFTESYFFEDLQLDRFTLEEDTFADPQPVIKAIKQSLINDFDDIVIFNPSESSSVLPIRPADEIEISKEQLRFIWHSSN